MNKSRPQPCQFPLLACLALIGTLIGRGTFAAEILPPGFRPLPLGVHALVGGKVVVRPGEVVEGGTIVIRDGIIQAVGKDVTPPADARVWDMKGLTVYAGFIEPYLALTTSNAPVSTTEIEPVSTGSPTAGGINFFGAPGQKTDRGNPGAGYELAKITPEYRAARDYSPNEKTLAPLRELGFTTGVIAPEKGVIRGTSALVGLCEENPNAIVIRAEVFQHIAFETHGRDEQGYPAALMGTIASVRQAFFDAQHHALERADYEKNPQGRKRPEFDPALESLGAAAEKKMRVAIEPGSALMAERAARVASELGLDYCLVSSGQEWRRPDLIRGIGARFIVGLNFSTLPKLPNEADWSQIKLEQLRAWDWAPENAAVLRKQGLEIALSTYGLSDKKKFRENLRLALERGLSEEDALAGLTTVPARLCGVEKLIGTIEAGKLANLTVVTGKGYFDADSKVREVWIDGRAYRGPGEEKEKEPEENKVAKATPSEEPGGKPKTEQEKSQKQRQLRELQKTRVARAPLEGRGPIAQPKAVLVRGATVWTSGPQGRVEETDVLAVGGKIKAIGKGLSVPAEEAGGSEIIEGKGLHVSPGLIDCHSHTAILGEVNESSLPSTAMVRIRDVINSETDNLYQQLAGGVTTVNLLHGSANPIGGQNCVIKLRDGQGPEGLIFEGAPPGIKFALGENVKQSNWGEKFATRMPQSRMGVRTFIGNRFTAAQQYLKEWDKYKSAGGVPPRRDLELEAIGEIIQGKRWIHCHSYRQDEILMLIRLMESFGVKIATFQHVLEGYKVADEIARHGAGASTFSDWWAYKFEVYDAIPCNGSLMRERGVVVSFNSDSSELARRLYLEAAKAAKYGGTSETEALKFVTINPAIQLGIDKYAGSLEPGKDADFVVWSKSPLDSGTVCLQTWIDGKKYFDRSLAAERAAKLGREREELIAKAKKIAKLAGGGEESGGGHEGEEQFFQVSLEHEFDGCERHCLEEGGL